MAPSGGAWSRPSRSGRGRTDDLRRAARSGSRRWTPSSRRRCSSTRCRARSSRPSGADRRTSGWPWCPATRPCPRDGAARRRPHDTGIAGDWSARSSPRTCIGSASKRASARWYRTRPTSSPSSTPTTRSGTRARRLRRMLGYEPADLEGTNFFDLIHEDDVARVRGRPGQLERRARTSSTPACRHQGGDWLSVEITANDLTADPNVAGIVLNTRDVSERGRSRSSSSTRPSTTRVTGLANRALFHDRVAPRAGAAGPRRRGAGRSCSSTSTTSRPSTTASATRPATASSSRSASRLRTLVRGADTVARLGGDEFARPHGGGARRRGRARPPSASLEGLKAPVPCCDGKDVLVRASLGIAIVEASDARAERRGAPAQRRRRDVHGEGRGQGPLRGLRADDAQLRV